MTNDYQIKRVSSLIHVEIKIDCVKRNDFMY